MYIISCIILKFEACRSKVFFSYFLMPLNKIFLMCNGKYTCLYLVLIYWIISPILNKNYPYGIDSVALSGSIRFLKRTEGSQYMGFVLFDTNHIFYEDACKWRAYFHIMGNTRI